MIESPSSLAQFSYTASEYKLSRFICGWVDDRVDNIEEHMIQVNCHLSSSRFQFLLTDPSNWALPSRSF